MNKKTIVLAVLAVITVGPLFAQVSVDPNDPFYMEAQGWQMKGLVSQLPQLRPYPVNVIRRIIEEVIAAGINEDGTVIPRYERDVALAMDAYKRIFSRPYHLMAQGTASFRRKTEIDADDTKSHGYAKQLSGEAAAEGDVVLPFTSLVTAGYHFGIWGTSSRYSSIAPHYVNQMQDSVYDAAAVGPFDFYLNVNCALAFGTEQYYATAGLSRVGYGPFLQSGLALNDTAYHAAGITLNVIRPRWSFTTLYETIGTTNNICSNALSDSKYLSFHAIQLHISPVWSLSYYENLVMGPESSVLYMLPAPYMAIQNLGGASANLQMGLLLEYQPFRSLKVAADVFVDDFDVQEVAKLNFDSKIRLAGQLGTVFTPFDSPLTYMTFNYTLVLPYVYAHWEYDANTNGTISGSAWNYQNYTNNGITIGASIPPDSDRVAFFARFNPKRNIQLDVSSSFVRHQNVAESFSEKDRVCYMLAKEGTYRTDGSVFTHQMFAADDPDDGGKHVDAAWNHLSFMSGDHTMLVCQMGISGQYTFTRFAKGSLAIKVGYLFEYIHNAGVDTNIYPGYVDFTDNGDGTYEYNGTQCADEDALYAAALAAADKSYSDWVRQLTNRVHNYLTLSVKYTY